MEKHKFNCRFYENVYPQVDEHVIVRVMKIDEYCTYVSLLEYNEIEGMITPNEYTKVHRLS